MKRNRERDKRNREREMKRNRERERWKEIERERWKEIERGIKEIAREIQRIRNRDNIYIERDTIKNGYRSKK